MKDGKQVITQPSPLMENNFVVLIEENQDNLAHINSRLMAYTCNDNDNNKINNENLVEKSV